jgi:nucleoid-associated protein YgaU
MAAILRSRSEAVLRHHPNPDHHGLRLVQGGRSPRLRATYRRRRLVVAILAVMALAVAVAGGRAVLGTLQPNPPGTGAVSSLEPAAGPVVVVQAGDTLWGIARRLAPGADVRPVVDQLAAAHGTGPLQPGERLAVGEVVGVGR